MSMCYKTILVDHLSSCLAQLDMNSDMPTNMLLSIIPIIILYHRRLLNNGNTT